MTKDCPNIAYVGRTELVVVPVENKKILFEEVRSYNLEPFVEGYIKGCSLINFLLCVVNLLKKQTENGEKMRLNAINEIETLYVEQTKSYLNCGFTEVSIQIDNAILKHMKWTEERERYFISYSTKDTNEAIVLKEILQKRSKDVWMAPEGIPVPMNYLCAIPAAIRITSKFIVLLSESSANSFWVISEVEKATKINRKIFGVLVGDFTIKDLEKFESMDFLLSRVQIKHKIQDLIENESAINDIINN